MSSVSFDGVAKVISITTPPDVDGVVTVDVKVDLYSAWKEWALTGDNAKYLQAMRAVGGDQISATQSLGATFFLMNDWRVRPYEASHRLVLSGNLYTDPAGSSPVINTLGAYNVVIEYAVSNLVDSVNSAQEASIQHGLFAGAVHIDTSSSYSGTVFPVGTPQAPVNNLADAMAIAVAQGFKRIHCINDLIIDSGANYTGYIFEGDSPLSSYVNVSTDATVTDCEFQNLHLEGVLDANAWVTDCEIGILTGAQGRFLRCGISNVITIGSTGAVFLNCYATRLTALENAVIDMGGSNYKCAVHNFTGHLALRNMAGGIFGIQGTGDFTIESTVTAGMVHLVGNWEIQDYHTGTANLLVNYVQPTKADVTAAVATLSTQVAELYKLAGLDPAKPLTVTATSRAVDTIAQTIAEAPPGTVTVTRT